MTGEMQCLLTERLTTTTKHSQLTMLDSAKTNHSALRVEGCTYVLLSQASTPHYINIQQFLIQM